MRKWTVLSLLALFSLVNVSAKNVWYGAQYEDDNGYVYEYMSQSGAHSQHYEGFYLMAINGQAKGEVVIPDSIPFAFSENDIEYFSVVGIYSFAGCSDLRSIVIPEGVKYIGRYAFQDCSGLTSITIPSNVEYIGDNAFANCTGLESVTFVKGENVYLNFGNYVFECCSNLKTISLHSNIQILDNDNPFVGCSNLESITVDPENQFVDSRNNCNAIIKKQTDYYGNERICLISGCKNTVVPSDVSAIEGAAFYGSSLTSIVIPAGVTYISPFAFRNCCNLEAITVDPENKVYDSRDNCNAIIEKKDSIDRWQQYRYKDRLLFGCNKTTIPPTVTRLASYSFFNSGLDSIYIPAAVTVIETGCFMGSALRSIVVDPDNAVYDSRNNCNAIIRKQDNELAVGCKETVIPESVSSIGSYAFAYMSGLDTVIIPKGVCTIQDYSFFGCAGLKTVVIPEGVETIEVCAFQSSDIEAIEIPKSVRRIGRAYDNYVDGVFARCFNLCSVVFESESVLDTIGNYTFHACKSLKSIIIPETVTYIGKGAFSNCSNLTSITMLPERVDMISVSSSLSTADCYENCTLFVPSNWYYLYKIRNPWAYFKDIKILEDKDCYTIDGINYKISSLEDKTVSVVYGIYSGDIVIPSSIQINGMDYSVKHIGREAFVENKQLTSVTLPEGITNIGDYAFSECDNLSSVIIPNSVQDIGLAFYRCGGIKSISLPSGFSSIKDRTFYGCSSLETINIPSGVETIGESAFYGCKSLTSFIIPDGVNAINDYTFCGCNALSYLYVPSSVDSFGRDAFKDCFNLQSAGPKGEGYNFEFSWDTIPGCAFSGMRSLKSVYIPKSVKLINDKGVGFKYVYYTDLSGCRNTCYRTCYFDNCDSLESLAISFSDTKIMRRISHNSRYIYESPVDYSIHAGTPIHSITILDDTIRTLATIGTGTIDEYVISGYVKKIYPGIFCQLKGVVNIEVDNNNSYYSSENGVLFNKDRSKLLAYPTARRGKYIVPGTVSFIGSLSFKGCKGLSSVRIPSTVKWIGESAFEICDSLKEVLLDGSPEIGLNAFAGSNNIESIWTRSAEPGLIIVNDIPQTIVIGDCFSPISCTSFSNYLTDIKYDNDLEVIFREVKPYDIEKWGCDIVLSDVSEGKYKLSLGVLPSPDGLPVYIHPSVSATYDRNSVVLLDSLMTYVIYDSKGRPRTIYAEYEMSNDVSGYDTLNIGIINVLDGYHDFILSLRSDASESLSPRYSSTLLFDKIYLEPLDKDIPVERYAGPFTENVFNNATLYVPDGAVDTYKAADGWNLFKHIAVNTRSYPADEVEVTISDAGYATFYYSDGDYALPEDLYAMVVSGIFNDRLVYEIIAGGSDNGVVPAGVPVILVSNDKKAGVYKLPLANRTHDYVGLNLLMGSDTDAQTYAENCSRFYKLAYGPAGTDLSDVLGWYWGAADGGAFNIEAHKAWLALPKVTTKGMTGFSLTGDLTCVIGIDEGHDDEMIIYDMYGRRVPAPLGSGLYIINGKKIMITE